MADGARLPGTEPDDDQVVAHVDMDCFYAACERLREPALRGEPLVVGMGYEPGDQRGAVATASYEARAYGVESAMPIGEALEKLPRKRDAVADDDLDVADAGFYRPVDLDYYESVSEDVMGILHDAAAVVREVSIDEAYLDVGDRVSWDATPPASGERSGDGGDRSGDATLDPRSYARRLKDRIESEVGVVASVGVAPTMSAAKIASDHDKPDGLVVVEPDEVRSFLAPLPVEAIHNVGPVTARELREMDVETAGDLAAADPDALRDRFGQRGVEIYRFARGEDDREVTPRGRPKSLSKESSFGEATDDPERIRDRTSALADQVADRADREGALYQTIGIKVVTPPYEVRTRAQSLPGPVEDPDLVAEVARELLTEFVGDRVRKVGVRVSNLSFADERQAALDSWDGETAREEATDANDVDGGGHGDAGDASSDPTVDGSVVVTYEAADDGQARLDGWERRETVENGRSDDGATTGEMSTTGDGTAADTPGGDDVTGGDETPDGQSALADFE